LPFASRQSDITSLLTATMATVLTEQEMLNYVRNSQEKALDVERAFTAYLDDTPGNAQTGGLRSWVWDATTQKGGEGTGTLNQIFPNGYYKDHIFERQYISCIVMRRLKESTVALDGRESQYMMNMVFLYTRKFTNMLSNLRCIDGVLHAEKTAFFNVRAAPPTAMTAKLRAYLEDSAPSLGITYGWLKETLGMPDQTSIPEFMATLQAADASDKVRDAIRDVLLAVVKDLTNMPWCDPDKAPMFNIGATWPISRNPYP